MLKSMKISKRVATGVGRPLGPTNGLHNQFSGVLNSQKKSVKAEGMKHSSSLVGFLLVRYWGSGLALSDVDLWIRELGQAIYFTLQRHLARFLRPMEQQRFTIRFLGTR